MIKENARVAEDREPVAQLWLHFPRVRGKGCEGVLVLHSSERCDRALLIDGSAEQLEELLRWSKLRDQSHSRKRFEITWVVSHYHRDHIGQGHKLLGGAAEKYLVDVWCPTGLYSAWPEECESAFEELGPKLARLRRIYNAKSGGQPRISLPKLGKLENIWDFDMIRVGTFGGPHRTQVPQAAHGQENARSLVVIGMAEEWKKRLHPPFTFVLPGDAEEVTWKTFMDVLDVQNNLARKLPVALLKLSHHGSMTSNPGHALVRLLGDRSHRANQLVIRIRNAVAEPRRAAELVTLLRDMKLTLHDTRNDGDLWVRLCCGNALVRSGSKSDPALGLPECFRC